MKANITLIFMVEHAGVAEARVAVNARELFGVADFSSAFGAFDGSIDQLKHTVTAEI